MRAWGPRVGGSGLGFALFHLGLLGGSGEMTEAAPLPGRTVIETVCVDDEATGYGTFQSHNQKVVSNRNGIFMTHIRTRNEAFTAQQWRLSRSSDGGRSFVTLYQDTHATGPPVLETDEDDNVYLVHSDLLDGHAYLYRFGAEDQYTRPRITPIETGATGKYSLAYDRPREQLYYFAHNMFYVVGLDGTVHRSQRLGQDGPRAELHYPLLSLDEQGILHAAWTTQTHGELLYWDIHHMQSPDGGETWRKMDGTPLELPVVADHQGPTDGLIREDEYPVQTWLSNVLARDGKLHFVYQAQTRPARQHYVRFDLETARRDVDLWPALGGERLSLQGMDGFLASSPSSPHAPLYCVMSEQGRLACLASDDNGATWYDYAVSETTFRPYAIGGCRELTRDGGIIGSFTHLPADSAPQVYFFKIKGGLSPEESRR